MWATALLSDAADVATLAQQLRADRRRRVHRRRAAAGLVLAAVGGFGLVVGSRLVADASSGTAAVEWTGAATGPTAPPTTAPPPTTTTEVPDGLHPGLLDAFERAQAAAADAGRHLVISSGFRTPAEQADLLEDEIAERGSREEALWWVFPPDRSMHVQGLAIDVGDGRAADWLVSHGARYGLCRTLDWEWWHFEWRERWEDRGSCPAPAREPEDAPGP